MKENNIFQIGSRFPEIFRSVICLQTDKKIEEIEINNLKREIIEFLKEHNKFYVSDLAEALDVSPRKIVKAVNELKIEGFIRETD
jgi:predicted transcriptional regulator